MCMELKFSKSALEIQNNQHHNNPMKLLYVEGAGLALTAHVTPLKLRLVTYPNLREGESRHLRHLKLCSL